MPTEAVSSCCLSRTRAHAGDNGIKTLVCSFVLDPQSCRRVLRTRAVFCTPQELCFWALVSSQDQMNQNIFLPGWGTGVPEGGGVQSLCSEMPLTEESPGLRGSGLGDRGV